VPSRAGCQEDPHPKRIAGTLALPHHLFSQLFHSSPRWGEGDRSLLCFPERQKPVTLSCSFEIRNVARIDKHIQPEWERNRS